MCGMSDSHSRHANQPQDPQQYHSYGLLLSHQIVHRCNQRSNQHHFLVNNQAVDQVGFQVYNQLDNQCRSPRHNLRYDRVNNPANNHHHVRQINQLDNQQDVLHNNQVDNLQCNHLDSPAMYHPCNLSHIRARNHPYDLRLNPPNDLRRNPRDVLPTSQLVSHQDVHQLNLRNNLPINRHIVLRMRRNLPHNRQINPAINQVQYQRCNLARFHLVNPQGNHQHNHRRCRVNNLRFNQVVSPSRSQVYNRHLDHRCSLLAGLVSNPVHSHLCNPRGDPAAVHPCCQAHNRQSVRLFRYVRILIFLRCLLYYLILPLSRHQQR